MAQTLEDPPPCSWLEVLSRAAVLGAGVGVVCGTVVGTILAPVVGTLIGAIVGALIGAAVGLVNGLVLLAVKRVAPTRRAASAACAVTSGAISAALVGSRVGSPSSAHNALFWLIVAACTGLAAALGPIALRGAQPLDLGRQWGQRPVASVVGTTLAVGASGGVAIGGIFGLAIGVPTNLPTAPAAMVEGGFFGSVIGFVIAMFVAAVAIGPRLRPRR
jgi:hypothetical protein